MRGNEFRTSFKFTIMFRSVLWFGASLALLLFPALCWTWPPTKDELKKWCKSLQWEQCEETQQLLAKSDKAVVRWLGESIDSTGSTPLHILAQGGNLCLLQVCLLRSRPPHCASMTTTGEYDDTPLHCAVWCGHLLVVQLLLAHGAPVTTANEFTGTPLDDAAYYGHPLIAQLLLAHRASVTTINEYGNTPLHCAASNGHLRVVQLLLNHGASVTATNRWGYTPLHCAAWYGHLPIVQLLVVAHGASMMAVNNDNKTSLLLATQLGRQSVVQFLSNPTSPAFNPSSLRHLTSFTVWHAVGRHINQLRALFDESLPPMLLTMILMELGFEACLTLPARL